MRVLVELDARGLEKISGEILPHIIDSHDREMVESFNKVLEEFSSFDTRLAAH